MPKRGIELRWTPFHHEEPKSISNSYFQVNEFPSGKKGWQHICWIPPTVKIEGNFVSES